MGFIDKIKQMLGGNKDKAKQGIDTASNTVESKVGGANASKVDAASDQAKDAVDKLPE